MILSTVENQVFQEISNFKQHLSKEFKTPTKKKEYKNLLFKECILEAFTIIIFNFYSVTFSWHVDIFLIYVILLNFTRSFSILKFLFNFANLPKSVVAVKQFNFLANTVRNVSYFSEAIELIRFLAVCKIKN